ncbi:MAG: flavodoxin family protein [Spirochaetaceae bacterium]|jgi:multimeric flavodoxin WrbA|nr:flavodoxin family protein [Spirochaetaceae bacterium]
MTALVITGSPRKNGVSSIMTKCFEDLWREASGENQIILIDSYKTAAKPCIHCGECKKKNSCIYNDLDVLDAALKTAGALVVSSPVYVQSFPAPFKAILDRMQRYFEEKYALGVSNPIPKHKRALFMTAQGSQERPLLMEEQLRLSLRLMNATLERSIAVLGTDFREPDFDFIRKEIRLFIDLFTNNPA